MPRPSLTIDTSSASGISLVSPRMRVVSGTLNGRVLDWITDQCGRNYLSFHISQGLRGAALRLIFPTSNPAHDIEHINNASEIEAYGKYIKIDGEETLSFAVTEISATKYLTAEITGQSDEVESVGR